MANLQCLQRQEAEMGEEKACSLELLGGSWGFAVSLWVRERLGPPQVFTVTLQGVLIFDLLRHHAAESLVLQLQLQSTKGNTERVKSQDLVDCSTSAA